MATIDYKQKIKDYMNSSEVDTLYKSMLNNLFPELKESEERIRESLLEYLHTLPNHYAHSGICATEWIAWLEKLNLIMAKSPQLGEQKPAWGEEDDDNMMLIEDRLSDYLEYIREDSTLTKHRKNSLKEEVTGYVNWLKSLIPQSTWKPSDEQLIELRRVISGCSYDIEPLVELETKLKEL